MGNWGIDVVDDSVTTCFVVAGVDRAVAVVAGVDKAGAGVERAVAGVDRDVAWVAG